MLPDMHCPPPPQRHPPLVIFANFCEAYLGVAPSVAFFRSFYALHSMAPGKRSCCLSFRIADMMAGIHIPMAWGTDNKPITRVTKKVEDFRHKCVLVDMGEANTFCDVPEALPMKHDSWSSREFASPLMGALVRCMKLLRDADLTGQMVAHDFIQRCIAPLQAHTRPMWMYSGPLDNMRLHPEALPEG